jgi:2-iminobutanoate/2-iminopropanoate deaminase|tara:strand:- start:1392 stop:1868 length:477 start_codon:yes stop_codon:yes gene_type:complete
MIKEDYQTKGYKLNFLLILICLISFNNYSQSNMKKVINSKNAPEPVGPYNQAILIDGTLYLSGQIALDPKSMKMDNSSIESETIRVLNNIEAVLKEASYDFSDIIKTTIFLTNMEDFNVVNEIYGKRFEKEFAPARETVEVSGLPKNAKIEISIIAKK